MKALKSILVSLVLVAASATSVNGANVLLPVNNSGKNIVKLNNNIDMLNVSGNIRVNYKQGNSSSIEIFGEDKAVSEVRVLGNKNAVSMDYQGKSPIVVSVVSPDLKSVVLRDNSEMNVLGDLLCNNLNVDLLDESTMEMNDIRCNHLNVTGCQNSNGIVSGKVDAEVVSTSLAGDATVQYNMLGAYEMQCNLYNNSEMSVGNISKTALKLVKNDNSKFNIIGLTNADIL